jgi:hypothetical protein
MTLVEFLTARLDEDEHVARVAVTDERGSGVAPWELWCITNPAQGEVHARPSRVLREVEAKRRIVGLWAEQPQTFGEMVAHLAEIYADHPDYREEWTP